MTKKDKAEIEIRLRWLGELLGTKFRLESWAPGDGWTRYSVVETDDGRHPGRPLFGDYVFNHKEIAAALRGAHYIVTFPKG